MTEIWNQSIRSETLSNSQQHTKPDGEGVVIEEFKVTLDQPEPSSVGARVGSAVGIIVGAAIGSVVGAIVGSDVGSANVCPWMCYSEY